MLDRIPLPPIPKELITIGDSRTSVSRTTKDQLVKAKMEADAATNKLYAAETAHEEAIVAVPAPKSLRREIVCGFSVCIFITYFSTAVQVQEQAYIGITAFNLNRVHHYKVITL